MSKLRELQSAVRGGHVGRLAWRSLRKRIFYRSIALGLRCDLTADTPAIQAKIPLTVRALTEEDRAALEPEKTDSANDFYERLLRLRMFDAGLRTCYGAFSEDGRVCYVQWLIEPAQNDLVHDFFEGSFPRLQPNEVLLEGAYTFPAFRGQGVMAAAMAGITDQGRARGFENAWTFVGEHNEPSLKGCRRAGYHEEVRRIEQWRFFRHSFSFTALAA